MQTFPGESWRHVPQPGRGRAGCLFPRHLIISGMTARLAVLLCAITVAACNDGLEPTPPPNPGFVGQVRFVPGTWPSTDSLAQIQLWIFAARTVPHDSASIVNGILMSPVTIFLYPSLSTPLPTAVDSLDYTFHVPTGSYQYLGVLQHFGADFAISSFKVVGIYQNPDAPGVPLPLTVSDVALARDVNITVNFHQPPPQPF